ncbi:MAG: ribonuclease E/G, partial [Acidobacteriota bacterium]
MSKQMLINVTQAEESRVAISENGILDWIEIETGGREKLKGNIYKGVVESVNSSLQAAFVKFASGARAGFLPLDEVNFRILPHRGRFSGKGGRQESPPERSSGRGSRSRISDHLKSGQELLVQVVREAYSSKPPTLSTFISIPGRYLVLLPGSETGGVSRRIEDESRRERLKKLIKELKVPDDMGLIVRTAGLDRSKTELGRDLRYLTRLWKQIETAWPKATPPALIFQERDLVLRAIRDLFTPDVREVLVDSEEIYKRAVRYFKSIMPGKQKLLKLYTGEQPLFTQYNLESQIENIYKRRVPL